MRVRLLAAIVAALMLAPTPGLACELACRFNARAGSSTRPGQDPHAHHHVGADVGSAALQPAPHGCNHGVMSERLAATATRTGAVTVAPVTLPTSRIAAMVPGETSWSPTTYDRAALLGVTALLPYLRI